MKYGLLEARDCWAALGMILVGAASWAEGEPPLRVAVANADIAPIVKAVGGEQVAAFTLFTGCLVRRNLEVEPPAREPLLGADVIVWTGFLPEASAIRMAVAESEESARWESWCPPWINVSKGAEEVDAPVSSCLGYVDLITSHGDPYFWLNPKNGGVIATNVASGLAALRPAQKARFEANANAFKESLAKDISRFKEQLGHLGQLVVFSTQCGWQNFGRLGGPTFVVCKRVPGCVISPETLVRYAKQSHVTVVLLDTHTPDSIVRAFRETPGWVVVDLASSLEEIRGAETYSALFDGMISVLQKASAQVPAAP